MGEITPEVIKVASLEEAAEKVPTGAVTVEVPDAEPGDKSSPMQVWENIVRSIIARSKGTKPEEVTLPEGGTGKYIKYALDKTGKYLSLGKGHGRRKVRMTTQKAEMQRIAQRLVIGGLQAAFRAAQAEAEKASTPENKVEMKPLDMAKVKEIQDWAQTHAPEIYRARLDGGKSKAARKRHRMSRRVGFGLVQGNKAKNTFSA